MDSQHAVVEEPLTPDPPAVQVGWLARVRSFIRPRRRWCLGTRLVVAASLAWLLFVVLHRLLSGRTGLWAPLDLIPPFLLVAVPTILLAVAPLARPVRWRIMAVLAVAGLLGGGQSGINLTTLWYTPPPAPPEAITVVSWNTEFWDQDWRNAGGDGYRTDFYDYLRELDADVYLLTEYLYSRGSDGFQGDWTADMAEQLNELPRLRREFPGYQIATIGEQITLSRFPIVRQRGLDLRPWLPADQREVPPALSDFAESHTTETLRTDILVDDATVSFYNTQVLQPPLDWRLYRGESRDANGATHARREASYRAIREDVAGNQNPVVLAGDLNTSPAMGIRRLLPESLVDHTPALSSVYPASWLAGTFELWRLDWLLTTEDVTVHRYELLGADGHSDHRPQRVVLSVAG